MQVAAQEAGIGYSLLMEAARKSKDPDLYRRAVNVALESRSVDAAKDAAQAWATALPTSPEPQRVLLQLMLASNALAQSAAPLEKLLNLVPNSERNALIDLVGDTYALAKDKATSRQVVGLALQPWTERPDTAGSAWAARGLLALGSGQKEEALVSLRKAMAAPPGSGAPGMLAVEMLNARVEEAAPLLQAYLEGTENAPVAVRMAYMRHLLNNNRSKEARVQLEAVVAQDATVAEAWLVLGALSQQQNQFVAAEDQLKRYLALSNGVESERAQRGQTQAYLSLAQIAEARGDLDAASEWLDRIDGLTTNCVCKRDARRCWPRRAG